MTCFSVELLICNMDKGRVLTCNMDKVTCFIVELLTCNMNHNNNNCSRCNCSSNGLYMATLKYTIKIGVLTKLKVYCKVIESNF